VKPLRVLIVDDEPAARSRLRRLLDDLEMDCVGEAADAIEALDHAAALAPDVLLLDIAMPEASGLDVARHLREPRPMIVFQTAHDEHAVAAFEQEAIDYLLKPVTRDRLAIALERVARRLAEGRRGPEREAIGRVARAGPPAAPARRVLVRAGAGHRLIAAREIARVTADEGLARVVAASGSFLTDYTIAELEARLGATFVRASRSDLVNVEWIDGLAAGGDGSATLTLRDRTTVHVSRRRAAALRRALEG
jgi:DNA-binding LytR/AlgR family response regulator